MNERSTLSALALIALVSLWLAPWAALQREVGARSMVMMASGEMIDFTGRTDALAIPGQSILTLLVAATLLLVVVAPLFPTRLRRFSWFFAGLALIVLVGIGQQRLSQTVRTARVEAYQETLREVLEDPRDTMDVQVLENLVEAPPTPLERAISQARDAGVRIRRLPYERSGLGLSAFLSIVVAILSMLFGGRVFKRIDRWVEKLLLNTAVPIVSLCLAMLAAAVVILSLQPTPLGSDVVIDNWRMYLIGRLDTLWYGYVTLFADSLGTLSGFFEALRFATPLIFTGLAVAFSFRAGLFNIGAPGQMIMGAITAMLAGVYLPGPRILVLPLAILAAAVGGGLWGALPGWLKARFGANEVINTILLNYIASSLLLFSLSANQIFAAPALRIITALLILAGILIVLNLIAPVRARMSKAPRRSFAVIGIVALIMMIFAGLPRPGDGPIDLALPFKAPGTEPRSVDISEASRIPRVPAMLGIDLQESPGTNEVPVNVAAGLAPMLVILALWLLPKVSQRFTSWGSRLIGALMVGVATYLLSAASGLSAVNAAIPPTLLNASLLLALGMAVVVHLLLFRTKWGYELRAAGLSPKAAEYGGANLATNTVMTMAISGALAGLTATHYVLGGGMQEYALRQGLPATEGFDGIAVALLGGNSPLGVIFAAFLFGVLRNGGAVLNITFSELTRDVVSMILALVVLFIAAKGFLPESLTNPLRRRPPSDAEGKPLAPDRDSEQTPTDAAIPASAMQRADTKGTP